jgi:hypothetical protein
MERSKKLRLYAQRALGPTCGENEADRRDFEWALLVCLGCGSETKAEVGLLACRLHCSPNSPRVANVYPQR